VGFAYRAPDSARRLARDSGKNDYDRAIADYNEAIQLDPNNATARNNLETYY
jgi:Flp pilus assembly protein TadD